MGKHLQIIRDLRLKLQLDPMAESPLARVGDDAGIRLAAKYDMIEALKECEYLLQIGDSVHKHDLG